MFGLAFQSRNARPLAGTRCRLEEHVPGAHTRRLAVSLFSVAKANSSLNTSCSVRAAIFERDRPFAGQH